VWHQAGRELEETPAALPSLCPSTCAGSSSCANKPCTGDGDCPGVSGDCFCGGACVTSTFGSRYCEDGNCGYCKGGHGSASGINERTCVWNGLLPATDASWALSRTPAGAACFSGASKVVVREAAEPVAIRGVRTGQHVLCFEGGADMTTPGAARWCEVGSWVSVGC
jgi:hypothetical protein